MHTLSKHLLTTTSPRSSKIMRRRWRWRIIAFNSTSSTPQAKGEWQSRCEYCWLLKIQMMVNCFSQEKLTRLRLLSYAHADVVLLCFSLIDPLSLESCSRHWINEIRAATSLTTPILLVGLKEDLEARVDRKMAAKVGHDLGCTKLVTCSALTLRGLKRVFDEALLLASRSQLPSLDGDFKWTASRELSAVCCSILWYCHVWKTLIQLYHLSFHLFLVVRSSLRLINSIDDLCLLETNGCSDKCSRKKSRDGQWSRFLLWHTILI